MLPEDTFTTILTTAITRRRQGHHPKPFASHSATKHECSQSQVEFFHKDLKDFVGSIDEDIVVPGGEFLVHGHAILIRETNNTIVGSENFLTLETDRKGLRKLEAAAAEHGVALNEAHDHPDMK